MGGDENIQQVVDAASVEPVVEPAAPQQAQQPVVEPAAPAANAVVEPVAPTAVEQQSLTATQQKAIASLLEKTSQVAQSFVKGGAMGPLGVTQMVSTLMKNVETLQVDGAKLAGVDKKKVVLEVGKQLITAHVSAEQRQIATELYEGLAEPTLEAMIDMSRGVNFATAVMNIVNDREAQVVVGKAARSCVGFCC